MKSYQAICDKNKILYGFLEDLSKQINAFKETDSEIDVSGLIIQKDELKQLIALNLEALEVIWNTQNKTWSNITTETVKQHPTGLQRRIINDFIKDSDQSFVSLARKYETSVYTVSNSVTKLLNKQFHI